MLPMPHLSERRPARAAAATVAALAASVALAAPLRAQDPPPGVTLGLEYGIGTRPGVLVTPVGGATGAVADSVRTILMRDLEFGDRVVVVGRWQEPRSSPVPAGRALNYGTLATLGAAAAVQANLTANGVAITVHDVGQKKVLRTRAFPVVGQPNSPEWRMSLHEAADEIEQWITGTRGISATQIAFSRGGQIYVTHADGGHTRAITSGGGTAMSPAWHPTNRMIAYSLLTTAGSQIMIRNLDGTGLRRLSPTGLNYTPTFSPDGRLVVYASGELVGQDLYAVPVAGGSRRRITVSQRVDNTSPTFSPDGRRVAFMSARTGRPEIWMASVEGGSPEMLTQYEYGVNSERSAPDWSPDNRHIAYQSQTPNGYQLMLLSLRDGSSRMLTSDGINEDPSWAPDGRHLVFSSTRGGSRQLWVLDIETFSMRQLTRGAGGARLAAWSGRGEGRTASPEPGAQ